MAPAWRVPVTFAFKSCSFVVAFRAAKAFSLTTLSYLMKVPSARALAYPVAEQRGEVAHAFVCPATSFALHIPSTTIPFHVSAAAMAEQITKQAGNFSDPTIEAL
jgi:hypothetical protein